MSVNQEKQKEISIVIPVYNSHECVAELSRQIADALGSAGISYEQIMVNDCSRDSSWDEIKKEAEKNPNLLGINLRKNGGQDSAILTGLNYASGKWIVIMDDDLQHSPYDIPKLYEEAKKGFDVVYANFETKKQKLWKNLGSWFNGKISEIALDKPKGIYLSPFKIVSGDVVKEMVKFDNLFPYIDGLIFQVTRNITQIDIEHHKRELGKSNYNLVKSIKVFLRMLFGFSTMPLNLASYTGFFSAAVGLVLAIVYAVQYFTGKADVTGWTTIVVLLLILGGLILVSLGIIGKYLGQMYLTVNKQPKFIVKETTK
ncbi:MAG: glycosyltransferase family 2 protein [Treponema sp.]|uniref:glycosyltransferase family 2 protein n=1 Tax=Treponema sp. TaxID=166 RepID=UPI0025D009D9|nr:glycosyltransferase family 2 protein [Treponema sp.]MBQ8679094.1 glycosyltransferase family 2 protein [Treponema sp.]